jgi:phage/plasmid-associated DNA primase
MLDWGSAAAWGTRTRSGLNIILKRNEHCAINLRPNLPGFRSVREWSYERQSTDERYNSQSASAPDRQRTTQHEARPPAFTDEALALRFAEQHAGRIRFVDPWGRWLTWNGTRWEFDETLAAYDMVRAICRAASAECNRENVAAALASAKTVAAVERLARSDRRLAATVDQWDRDPWLLNTPGGIVDLRTGKRPNHRPEAYLTKITAVAPNKAHPTPVWEAFLQKVTRNDPELIGFLRRMTGYALTGVTHAHALKTAKALGLNVPITLQATADEVIE